MPDTRSTPCHPFTAATPFAGLEVIPAARGPDSRPLQPPSWPAQAVRRRLLCRLRCEDVDGQLGPTMTAIIPATGRNYGPSGMTPQKQEQRGETAMRWPVFRPQDNGHAARGQTDQPGTVFHNHCRQTSAGTVRAGGAFEAQAGSSWSGAHSLEGAHCAAAFRRGGAMHGDGARCSAIGRRRLEKFAMYSTTISYTHRHTRAGTAAADTWSASRGRDDG